MAQKKKKDAKKDPNNAIIAQNKKARHNYNIVDTYEAGIVLLGTEVKSLRDGGASIVDGFCQVTDNELWLEGYSYCGVRLRYVDEPCGSSSP